jgi:transcriptional regulator with XRE-family HTH domain
MSDSIIAFGYLLKLLIDWIIFPLISFLEKAVRMKNSNSGAQIKRLLGRNLKRLRVISNISQVSLANSANLAHNFVNDIENGKKWVSAGTIEKLAAALKAEPYQFFISESKWNEQGAEIFSHYIDDFSDSVVRMAKEYRRRYLPENPEAGEGKNIEKK